MRSSGRGAGTTGVASDMATALKHAVGEDQGRVVSGLPGRGFGDAVASRNAVMSAIGARLAVVNATHLVGIRRGVRTHVGAFRFNGKIWHFSLWVPHLGIAVDLGAVDEDVVEAKRVWCAARQIIYVWPGNMDIEALRVVALERREASVSA